jgi:Zn-dependent protease
MEVALPLSRRLRLIVRNDFWALPIIVVIAVIIRGDAEYFVLIPIVSGVVFFSVLAHELAHVGAAAFFGVSSVRVEISLLGGRAYLRRIPEKRYQLALLLLAGPVANALLAGVAYLLLPNGMAGDSLSIVETFLRVAFVLNAVMAVANLLPALPLDGGILAWIGAERIVGSAAASRLIGLSGILIFPVAAAFSFGMALAGYPIIVLTDLKASATALRRGQLVLPSTSPR